MPTTEYLESILNSAKKYLPPWLMTELHKLALPSAGGKARWREPEEPSFLEKMALADIRPEKLKDAPDDEVRLAWLRVAQWYSAAKKRGDPVEGIVNATTWLMDEFDHRGWTYEDSDLVQEARKLQGVKKAQSIEATLAKLPAEVVLVPNFVSVVGSAATGKEKPGDIDVLIRANRDGKGENFLVQADNVWLPVRKVLDPEKKGVLHFIDSAAGPHANFVPCFSLVLRREEPKRQVVKTAYPAYISDRCLEILDRGIGKLDDEDFRWLLRAQADEAAVEKDWTAHAPEKVATRLGAILAASDLKRRGVVEFFAGEHFLTGIYKHYADRVVTVDKAGTQDYEMTNERFIEKHGAEHNAAAIYDFDDQGICGDLILKWLQEGKPEKPFVLTYTYGTKEFQRGGPINTWRKMRTGADEVRQIEAGGKYWVHATELAEEGLRQILKEAGYHGEPLIALRRSSAASQDGARAGDATYGTWLVA